MSKHSSRATYLIRFSRKFSIEKKVSMDIYMTERRNILILVDYDKASLLRK